MAKKHKISRKALKHVQERAKTASSIIEYLFIKLERIRMETGLVLVHTINNLWMVQDNNFRVKKKGTLHQCADYIIDQWKKMK